MSTAPARRRTRVVGVAVAALTGGLALQPMLTTPAQAGVNCGSTDFLQPPMGDCEAPESVITAKPATISFSPAAVFEFTTEEPDEDDPEVTFECKIEAGAAPDPLTPVPGQAEGWTDCSVHNEPERSLGRAEYLDLAAGDYTFSVRATDVASPVPIVFPDVPNTETTPATYSWSVVEDAPSDEDVAGLPQTTITTQPKRWHVFPYAEVRFTADEPAMAYVCRAKGQRVPCDIVDDGDDQYGVAQIFGMGAGDWDFEVAAIDLSGNVDPSPAKAGWILPRNNYSLKKHSKDDWVQRRKRGHFLETISLTTTKGAFIRQGTRDVREMVLVTTKCPKCGKVKVTFAGKTLKKIDLRATKQKKRKVIRLGAWRKPQSGRLVITSLTQGKKVIVEGVGFTRQGR